MKSLIKRLEESSRQSSANKKAESDVLKFVGEIDKMLEHLKAARDLYDSADKLADRALSHKDITHHFESTFNDIYRTEFEELAGPLGNLIDDVSGIDQYSKWRKEIFDQKLIRDMDVDDIKSSLEDDSRFSGASVKTKMSRSGEVEFAVGFKGNAPKGMERNLIDFCGDLDAEGDIVNYDVAEKKDHFEVYMELV